MVLHDPRRNGLGEAVPAPATDVARGLDAVEKRGESFLIVRRGRPVARLGPAAGGSGAAVKELLRQAPRDRPWVADVAAIRAALRVEERDWNG